MIKKSLLVGMAASVMLFSACSSSEEVDYKTTSNENQIQVQLNASGSGLVSRSAREIYTTAAADNVDHVTLKLYRYVGGQWEPVEGCFDNDEIEWAGSNSTITTNIVKVKKLDENTQYKVVAYGYNGTPCPYKVSEQGNALLATDGPKVVEELFAGVSEVFQTDSDGLISELVNVEMTRQVAGLLAYFYNIPVLKILPGTTELRPVRYINVYTCSKVPSFFFPSKGQYNGSDMEVVKTKALGFDLKDYIADYDQQVEAAGENFSATFTIAPKEGKVTTLPNSIIKGSFLLPYSSHVEANTMAVELEDADGNVLKHWDVSYGRSTGNIFQFDIQRNCFYGLGKKVYDEATPAQPGEDPSDPDSPADNPLDMSSVELTVQVIDKWDKVFYMTLE